MTRSISARSLTYPPGRGFGGARKAEATVLAPRDVHEQVERARHVRRCQTELSQPSHQVVSTVVVMPFNAQEGITVAIARCDQGIVHSTGGILDQGKDWTTSIGAKNVSDPRHKPKRMRACVLHGHELAQLIAIERPGVDHLLSVGIDHFNVLSACYVRRSTLSRRYLNCCCVHSVSSLGAHATSRLNTPRRRMRHASEPRARSHPQCSLNNLARRLLAVDLRLPLQQPCSVSTNMLPRLF